MNETLVPRIVIAGTHSGVGKTTIVTGLLAAFKQQGLSVQSYKVGPDYIDPGYHRLASGKTSHNLDSWLVPTDKLLPIFARTAEGCDLAVIEGVMGLYDGGRNGVSSTAAIAKLLKAPVVLVVDAKSMGESVAATVLGYKLYDPEVLFAGVIVNRLGSESHRIMVCDALARLDIPVLGTIFRNDELIIGERHLGLTPVTETEAQEVVSVMGREIARQVDLVRVREIAIASPALELEEVLSTLQATTVRIGVAQDEVFSFYYPESIDQLAALGAEIVPFSPLHDAHLPQVDGLILGGGFPEMFLEQLTANKTMMQEIADGCQRGMPVYAECGGLMYLSKQITSFSGENYEMCGVVPATSIMQTKLQTVGYVEVTALRDTVLCNVDETIRGHEFHFSKMVVEDPDTFPWAFDFKKVRTGAVYPGGYATKNVLASYLHMHFAGNLGSASVFVTKCREFRGI